MIEIEQVAATLSSDHAMWVRLGRAGMVKPLERPLHLEMHVNKLNCIVQNFKNAFNLLQFSLKSEISTFSWQILLHKDDSGILKMAAFIQTQSAY